MILLRFRTPIYAASHWERDYHAAHGRDSLLLARAVTKLLFVGDGMAAFNLAPGMMNTLCWEQEIWSRLHGG